MNERTRGQRSRVVARAAVTAGLVLGTSTSIARIPTAAHPWDEVDDRRECERTARDLVRTIVRGRTWAVVPPDGCDMSGRELAWDSPDRPMVSVSALAVGPSGEAIVGGAVRGKVRLGSTLVARTEWPRGFVGRIDSSGNFRVLRLDSGDVSALALDRASHIVASYEDGALIEMTSTGQRVWSTRLPPARAIAFAPNGDIFVTGCVERHEKVFPQMAIGPPTDVEHHQDGYVARVSPRGEIIWRDRFDDGAKDLFYRGAGWDVEDCGWGIAPGPSGDLFISGTYARKFSLRRPADRSLPEGGTFLARFSANGSAQWSRLVKAEGAISLAVGTGAAPVVIAGRVVPHELGLLETGVVGFDLDGVVQWSLPIRADDGRPVGSPGIDKVVVAATPGGRSDLFVAGLHDAPIQAGRARLAAKRHTGLFVGRLDGKGGVISLNEVPSIPADEGAGDSVASLILAVGSRSSLWLAGTTHVETSGGWAQRVQAGARTPSGATPPAAPSSPPTRPVSN
jgi:hypothetical protein